ncbi:MAG: hypothetical protein V1676_01055 [Candidatus Diapherotrites archaeon]
MEFFITLPEHDDTTAYLSAWAGELIELAKQKGLAVFEFRRERASAAEVGKFLGRKNPKLAMFNGHGGEDWVAGHRNEVLIKSGQNERLLKDKVIYCRSCSSAAKLGRDCVQSGAAAFIGYCDLFGFPINPQKSATPLRDEFAKPCLDVSNQAVKSLLKGNTAGEAYVSSQAAAERWIEKLQQSDAPPEAPHLLLWLLWNKAHQKIHGNKSVRL